MYIYLQVRALKEELAKALTASSAATAAAAAATAATAKAATTTGSATSSSSPPPAASLGANVGVTETTVVNALAVTGNAPAQEEPSIHRSASIEAWVEEGGGSGGSGGGGCGGGDDDLSPAQHKAKEAENVEKAKELESAERELENLREREQDARGEAERIAEELQRAR